MAPVVDALLHRIGGPDAIACARVLGKSAPELLSVCALLPAKARKPAILLGAVSSQFLDEARQEGVDPRVVSELRARVDAAYAGRPDNRPLDRAIAELATKHHLPRAVLDAALEAAEWDATGRRYATFDNLIDYCVRAGAAPAVGMTHVLGVRDRAVFARATDLGIAIALTMIARDVAAHARQGRVLLPIEWLEEANVDVDTWIDDPTPSRNIHDVVSRVLSAAERFYKRADPGIRVLPRAVRPAVRVVRYSYKVDAVYIGARSFDRAGRFAAVPLHRRILAVTRSLRAAEARDIRAEAPNGAFTLDHAETSAATFLVDAAVA